MLKVDRLKVRSIFLSSPTRQTQLVGSFTWLAALASVCCPEKPVKRIFCLRKIIVAGKFFFRRIFFCCCLAGQILRVSTDGVRGAAHVSLGGGGKPYIGQFSEFSAGEFLQICYHTQPTFWMVSVEIFWWNSISFSIDKKKKHIFLRSRHIPVK